MNIFAQLPCPVESARILANRHVVKMTLETAQMLCTALSEHGIETPYKPVHQKHPCTIWAGKSRDNFTWLCKHGLALADEYTRRYGKDHSSEKVIAWAYKRCAVIPAGSLTPFAQAMPDELKVEGDSCEAYRKYINWKYFKWAAAGRPPRFVTGSAV